VSPTVRGGLGLAVLGLFLLFIGGAAYSSCVAGIGSAPQGCGVLLGLALLGVAGLIGGILLAVASRRSFTYVPPSRSGVVPPPIVAPVVVNAPPPPPPAVSVRCRYCGTEMVPVDGRCPSCGAPI